MLHLKKIEVKLHGNNRRHYESMGYPWLGKGKSIFVYPEQVPKKSNTLLPAICEYCHENHPKIALFYWQYKHGITGKYCCDKEECKQKHKELILLLTKRKHPDERLMMICADKGLTFIKKFRRNGIQYILCKCKKHPEKTVEVANNNLTAKGKVYHCSLCYSDSRKGCMNPAYDFDKTDEERNRTRFSFYKRWKKELMKNDFGCCVVCGSKKSLEGHHLTYTEDFELKSDSDNGVLVCKSCHISKDGGFHHKYGKKFDFTPMDFLEFLEEKQVNSEIIDRIRRRIEALEIKLRNKFSSIFPEEKCKS